MSPSSPHGPDPWRRRNRAPRRRHLKHPWITSALLLLACFLGFGALLDALEDDGKAGQKSTAPGSSSPSSPSPGPTRDTPSQSPTKPTKPANRPSEQQSTERRATEPQTAEVLRVIDGDTIEILGDGRIVPRDTVVRVRLLEIDTPERGACFADAATARTTALLPPGSSARIERDVELIDPYDRHLLYVWNDDGVFVNESLVRSGHAEAVLYPPNDKHWATISTAETTARRNGTGLWSACAGAEPAPPETPARPDLPEGPPAGVPDVDCSDLSGPVWVGPDDPHRLDRDGDGIGCESN